MTIVSNHLNHSPWECKYHVVFTPKYRKKALYGMIRRDLKDVFHRLAKQKDCLIEEGFLMPDHVHMLLSIPPKHSVAQILGFFKGKSSIWEHLTSGKVGGDSFSSWRHVFIFAD